MVTVLYRQRHGYDVRIFTREHGPAHVHVFRGEKRVKVNLEPMRFSRNKGFTSHELRQIRELLNEHMELITREWERLDPDKR
jgi:hypothetical protein